MTQPPPGYHSNQSYEIAQPHEEGTMESEVEFVSGGNDNDVEVSSTFFFYYYYYYLILLLHACYSLTLLLYACAKFANLCSCNSIIDNYDVSLVFIGYNSGSRRFAKSFAQRR